MAVLCACPVLVAAEHQSGNTATQTGPIKRSHIGAAGMRSELTFERGGTVVIARVKSGEAKYIR